MKHSTSSEIPVLSEQINKDQTDVPTLTDQVNNSTVTSAQEILAENKYNLEYYLDILLKRGLGNIASQKFDSTYTFKNNEFYFTPEELQGIQQLKKNRSISSKDIRNYFLNNIGTIIVSLIENTVQKGIENEYGVKEKGTEEVTYIKNFSELSEIEQTMIIVAIQENKLNSQQNNILKQALKYDSKGFENIKKGKEEANYKKLLRTISTFELYILSLFN